MLHQTKNFLSIIAVSLLALLFFTRSPLVFAKTNHSTTTVSTEQLIDPPTNQLIESHFNNGNVTFRDRGGCTDFKGTYLWDRYCDPNRHKWAVPPRLATEQELKCLIKIGVEIFKLWGTPLSWPNIARAYGGIVLTCIN